MYVLYNNVEVILLTKIGKTWEKTKVEGDVRLLTLSSFLGWGQNIQF